MTISVILMSSSAQTCSRCPLTPPTISREWQQDRADDHHAFHEDAKPGDLSLQLPIRWRSSSKKFWIRINHAPYTVPLENGTGHLRTMGVGVC